MQELEEIAIIHSIDDYQSALSVKWIFIFYLCV